MTLSGFTPFQSRLRRDDRTFQPVAPLQRNDHRSIFHLFSEREHEEKLEIARIRIASCFMQAGGHVKVITQDDIDEVIGKIPNFQPTADTCEGLTEYILSEISPDNGIVTISELPASSGDTYSFLRRLARNADRDFIRIELTRLLSDTTVRFDTDRYWDASQSFIDSCKLDRALNAKANEVTMRRQQESRREGRVELVH